MTQELAAGSVTDWNPAFLKGLIHCLLRVNRAAPSRSAFEEKYKLVNFCDCSYLEINPNTASNPVIK